MKISMSQILTENSQFKFYKNKYFIFDDKNIAKYFDDKKIVTIFDEKLIVKYEKSRYLLKK